MIEVKDAPHWRHCTCCGEKAVKEFGFFMEKKNGAQGTVVALCPECIKRLFYEVNDAEN